MPAAWTLPRTWTAGELVTAAIGNSAWRDNLMYLKDSPTFDGNVTVTGTTLLTGVATLTAAPVFSSATASQAVFTDGSKALVSNAITGTGNVVMSASPTLTGTIAGAAMTLSSTLGVTGLITSTGGITGGASSHTTGAFSSTVTGGTYNGQTISSAANFTGTVTAAGRVTVSASGLLVAGSLNGYTDELSFTTASSGAQSGITSAGTGASVMNFSHLGSGNTGSWNWWNGTNATSIRMSLSGTGLLTVSGFGISTFSAAGVGTVGLQITNSQAGTGNSSYLALGNDSYSNALELFGLSSTYTTSGPYVQGAAVMRTRSTAGLSIVADNASGAIRFYSGGTTEIGQFSTGGNFHINGSVDFARFTVSGATNTRDLVALKDTGTSYSTVNLYAIFYNSTGGTAGSIQHTAVTTVAYNTASDMRLKRDLGLATDLSGLRALRVHEFAWIDGDTVDRNVFAQEAYAALPGRGVSPGRFADGALDLDPITVTKTWMVEKAGYVPDLIVGWQQHDATITQLAARIAALETKDN